MAPAERGDYGVGMDEVRRAIVEIPDFPQPGILFRDLLPLLADPELAGRVIDALAAFAEPLRPDLVLGAEARGFLFGPALALRLGVGFVPARKPGKLPGVAVREEYALEYGANVLEIHAHAIEPGSRVLLHDDLLATGGTAAAKVNLVRQLGGEVVGACFVAELCGMDGRARLQAIPVQSLVEYPGT